LCSGGAWICRGGAGVGLAWGGGWGRMLYCGWLGLLLRVRGIWFLLLLLLDDPLSCAVQHIVGDVVYEHRKVGSSCLEGWVGLDVAWET
jgi:hypothetical protein